MALSAAHRRFLIVDQGVGPIVVNFFLNGAIAWALFHSADTVPLWGQSSIAGDTLVTAFLLPLLTCLIVTRLVHRQVAGGRLVPPAEMRPSGLLGSLGKLSSARRGAIMGVSAVLVVAVPTVAWFASVGPSELPQESFLWFKATFAAVLAAGVTPLIGWVALVAASPARQAAGQGDVAGPGHGSGGLW